MKNCKRKSVEGFSLIELMVVLIIISIGAAMTGFYLSSHKKLYKPDDQSLQIVDLLQEARQRALTQRETMRVEIDLADNVVRLIEENTAITAADDRLIKQVTLLPANEINVEQRALDIPVNPPEPLPVTSAVYVPSIYPTSAPHRVCTLRFKSNGQVYDAGSSATGDSDTTIGATLHIWEPEETDATKAKIARAITIIGTTGSIRMWEYRKNSTAANKWSDSRRVGS